MSLRCSLLQNLSLKIGYLFWDSPYCAELGSQTNLVYHLQTTDLDLCLTRCTVTHKNNMIPEHDPLLLLNRSWIQRIQSSLEIKHSNSILLYNNYMSKYGDTRTVISTVILEKQRKTLLEIYFHARNL